MVTVTSTPLAERLLARCSTGGGWSYYPGRVSRIEPTCWAILALDPGVLTDPRHRAFLAQCQRSEGWLVEDPRWPVNMAFNALAAFTWLVRRDLASDTMRRRLLDALVAKKGQQIPNSPHYSQNNSLQAWPWLDATFSWVEPTAWGVLALKKAARDSFFSNASSRSRIEEADRLLFDRACGPGGWNYGNPNVNGRDLYAHIPTTALTLLALQDHKDQPAVSRGLTFLEEHWPREQSAVALGLSAICLRTYGRPIARLQAELTSHMTAAENARRDGLSGARRIDAESNIVGMAIALAALSDRSHEFFQM